MEITDCPFCGMPNEVLAVFFKDSHTYSAECPDCHACGPLETNPADALKSWHRRAHDVEWRYKTGLKIANKFCRAVGQTDRTSMERLGLAIAEDLR